MAEDEQRVDALARLDAFMQGDCTWHRGALPDAPRDECSDCGRAKFAATICSCDDAMVLDQFDMHPVETLGTAMSLATTGQDAWYRFQAERTRMDDEQSAA